MLRWDLMSAHTGETDPIIETITASVREALTRLRQRPGKPGCQKLVVHIDARRQTAFIELPPEVITIRQKRPG